MLFPIQGSEPQDYITCKICGHMGVTLARHLKAKHKITADAYRQQFPDALIRCLTLTQKRSNASKARPSQKGKTKIIECPSCHTPREVGWSFAPVTHEARCAKCVDQEKWEGKEEGTDFVWCVLCTYRAESLVSHIQSAHPEFVGKYSEQMTALNSSIRDKTHLKGKKLSEETRKLMSENAGRWNKGLTKDINSSLASAAEKMKGIVPWCTGLTKDTHPSLKVSSEKLVQYKGDNRPWNNVLKANLIDVDFTPYLDEAGAVDRKSMAEALDLDEITITKYMNTLGLRLSTKYVDARAERQTIRLEKEELQRFTLGNGKLAIGRAMVGLGRDFKVIKREAERHGFEIFTRNIRQTLCLDAVSKVLGGALYEQEWRSRKFMTPRKNFYRFDGYFPDHQLIVEFHGHQHYTFPSFYIRSERIYFELQERDRIKENLILADPKLRYFVLREDEPYTDQDYVRNKMSTISEKFPH